MPRFAVHVGSRNSNSFGFTAGQSAVRTTTSCLAGSALGLHSALESKRIDMMDKLLTCPQSSWLLSLLRASPRCHRQGWKSKSPRFPPWLLTPEGHPPRDSPWSPSCVSPPSYSHPLTEALVTHFTHAATALKLVPNSSPHPEINLCLRAFDCSKTASRGCGAQPLELHQPETQSWPSRSS